jgi:hypothetical protein
MRAHAHQAAAILFGHDGALTAQTVIDLKAGGVNRSDLSIGVESCRPSVVQSDLFHAPVRTHLHARATIGLNNVVPIRKSR